MAEPLVSLVLRLPKELHTTLVDLARADVRSLNGEILVLLNEALTARTRQERQQEKSSDEA